MKTPASTRRLHRPALALLATLTLALASRAQTNVVAGAGTVVNSNVAHANGNIYDQVLLTGQSVTLQADPGQILRCSFLDPNGDIVQCEFSGPGRFKIDLDPAGFVAAGPAAKYNQPGVAYVTGRPTVTIDDSTTDTYVNIFSVGPATAVNQALFPAGQTYDGVADVQLLQINGPAMGSLLLGNTRFGASSGNTGILAPNTAVRNRVVLHDIDATGSATPVLQLGGSSALVQDSGSILLAGGDLVQTNGAAVDVSAGSSGTLASIVTVANIRSDGSALPRSAVSGTVAFKSSGTGTLLLDGAAATVAAAGGGVVNGKELTFGSAAANAPYANGAKKTFDASLTTLKFDTKTLTNPSPMSLNAPLTGARFTDPATGFTWEVIFNNGVLHEINVMNGNAFLGQWS